MSNNIRLPLLKLAHSRNRLNCNGPKLFNHPPENIKYLKFKDFDNYFKNIIKLKRKSRFLKTMSYCI